MAKLNHRKKKNSAVDYNAESPAPWDANPKSFFTRLCRDLSIDAAAIGLLNTQQPKLDEVLAVHGWTTPEVEAWCKSGYKQDQLYKAAKRQGSAITSSDTNAGAGALPRFKHVMVQMVPESISSRRWWWMTIARRKGVFTPIEQEAAGLLLRQWQAQFNRLTESLAGRALIGQDGRLIHADPWTQALLVRTPQILDDLLEALNPVASQRWGGGTDQTTHDFFIKLAGRTYWVCFHRNQATEDPASQVWYIELRPLINEELPTVGELEDERIAQSLAFIHENYQQSPSLSQIAGAVNVSPFHFHRLFMRHVGVSPKQYLQRKQMQMAKWLLRASRLSIGNIAWRAGFASHGHFTSTFHRMIGMSPSQYREKN